MNLSQLDFAVAVAEKKSFTAAANSCHVTQPTLSNGIAQLEDELGGKLFFRTTRTVSLTPFGTHLLPYLKEILSARASLLSQAQSLLNPARQIVRIGTSPLVNTHLLGIMLDPFRREHPEVEIVLREMNMVDLYRMLDEGLLDYVFGNVKPARSRKDRWASAFLYDEPLLYIPSGAEPRVDHAESVHLKDIASDTYVMVPDACGLSHATRALFRSQRKTLHEYPGQALSYQVLEDWATLNVGAAIMPKSKVTRNAKAARVIRSKGNEIARIGFEAVWPQERQRAAHLLAFERHLRKVVPRLLKGLVQDQPDAQTHEQVIPHQKLVR